MIVNKTELLLQANGLLKVKLTDRALAVLITLARAEVENLLWELASDEQSLPKTFGELHDHCDANEFGGLCTVLITEEFDENADGGMGDEFVDFANKLQSRVNSMLLFGVIVPQQHTFI